VGASKVGAGAAVSEIGPRYDSHRAPAIRVDEYRVDKRRCGGQRGQRGEYTDMTDPLHYFGRDHRSQQEADEKAGHHESGYGGGESLHRGAQAQQRSLQPVAQHDERHAQQ
jgi:hypothetical protein